ncbi:S ribonuclease [Pyrus ussuriensis x Pyrus communis]|uniref:S ribonuclease n=1 Tax=Pyrus ussuriensis x Pyrus communis TaxID=2448454 RepID=A0A5N5H7G7_9ROSA|nr:S ribonuclease [Pyrus ussuriensis x Pyrus communis]
MRKLLEFDFIVAIDGAIKDGVTKIGDAKDEVSVKWLLLPDHLLLNWSSTENQNGLQASSLLRFSLIRVTNKVLSSSPSLDALKFGIGTANSRGARSAQSGAMVIDQGLPRVVEQVGTTWSSRLPPVVTCWSKLLFPMLGSFIPRLRCMWYEVRRLPLSYFETPRLRHAARANSPSWPTIVPVATMVVVLFGGKVALLAIVLSLVDRRDRATSCPPSFDPDL